MLMQSKLATAALAAAVAAALRTIQMMSVAILTPTHSQWSCLAGGKSEAIDGSLLPVAAAT
jgi:hypothetical protein